MRSELQRNQDISIKDIRSENVFHLNIVQSLTYAFRSYRTYRPKTNFLALSIGVVFLWFGILKFFPNLSPAEVLAMDTLRLLTFGVIPSEVSIILLATGEALLGICLILNFHRRFVVGCALIHILFTFSPLLFFPEQAFNDNPLQLTLLGQYITKNIIIIGGLVTILREDRGSEIQ